ncbi:hypothetical protein D3C80_1360730 [compost metagenome]
MVLQAVDEAMRQLQDQQVVHHEENVHAMAAQGIEVTALVRQHVHEQIEAQVDIPCPVADGLILDVLKRLAQELGGKARGVAVKRLAGEGIDRANVIRLRWVFQPLQQDATHHTLNATLAVMLAQLGNVHEQLWLAGKALQRIINGFCQPRQIHRARLQQA